VNWPEYVESWSRPPVDDLGYFEARDMLTWSDFRLADAITRMKQARYEGARNHGGLWRRMLGLDFTGRRVLEYGCGVGMEATELAIAGNSVAVADISQDNIDLACRVMHLFGTQHHGIFRVGPEWPFFNCAPDVFDVVNCSGVLHHIRTARLTVERFHDVLHPGGELRLMVYSDQGWRIATGTEPPADADLEDHPKFEQYVRFMDGVGDYATWYDEAKIDRLFGDLFRIDSFAYLTPDRRYCAAVLVRKDHP
jgi:SAM-dependent methyltransferase